MITLISVGWVPPDVCPSGAGLDLDVANGTVRTSGSHSRNLRRVRQGLDLIRALFEQFLSTKYVHPLSIFLFPFFFYFFSYP